MAPERITRLPDNNDLHRQVDRTPTTDLFGIRMLRLIRAVEKEERTGKLAGYARWLLTYEEGRRFMKLINTAPTSEDSIDYTVYGITLPHRIAALVYPAGKYVTLENFFDYIKE